LVWAAGSIAGAAPAGPLLTSIHPASGAAGTIVALTSPDLVAGSSYVVMVGVRGQTAVASTTGMLSVRIPADACQAREPVAFYASGSRSNSLPFEITSGPIGCRQGCVEVVRDRQYHCTHRAIDPTRHDVISASITDNRQYAADASDPTAPAVPVLDSFFEYGWATITASAAPGGDAFLVTRRHRFCPASTPGPGLTCSYGRDTLWLAWHWRGDPLDPDDDRWVHLNLAPIYGRNGQAMLHMTWLHERLALASLLVRGDTERWVSAPTQFAHQIHAIELGANGLPVRIAPFAPAELARSACFTGRTHAQPSVHADACTPGQRLAFTRRCFDEPDPGAWSWWNSTHYHEPAERCVAGLPQFAIPVLRSYVTELDGSCRPTRSFESMRALREPGRDALLRQVGHAPEWGDMEPAISADGRYAAVATLTGNPFGDPDNACAGFAYVLTDPADPYSGNAARRIHVCEIDDADLSCVGAGDEMVAVETSLSPPESTSRAGFVWSGARPSLIVSRQWSQSGAPPIRDVMRLDFLDGLDAWVPLPWGSHRMAPEVIPPSAP
jgi:hypothetical protein